MKRLVLALALLASATAAHAQNAAQIASARGGANCPGCNLFQADFGGLSVSGRSYAKARLRQADLTTAVMNRADFSGADLRDADGYGGVFGGANFAGADLTHATFVGAYLEGANFSAAKLTGANFSGAEMATARGLTHNQLEAACGDAATQLPRGLDIPRC